MTQWPGPKRREIGIDRWRRGRAVGNGPFRWHRSQRRGERSPQFTIL